VSSQSAREPLGLDQHGHLQGREQAIATHAVAGRKDMARLLAAQARTQLLHGLVHVLVTHGGALQQAALGLPGPLETQVGHHRGDDAVAWELSLGHQGLAPEIEDLVAIHDPAAAINGEHAVGIAIEGEAHAGAFGHHRLAQGLQVGAAAAQVDALPIRFAMEHGEVGAEGAKHAFAAGGGRAPAEIKHHLAAIEPGRAHAGDQAVAIGGQQVGALAQPAHATERTALGAFAVETRLDRLLLVLLELGAAGAEHLDAVVLGGLWLADTIRPPAQPWARIVPGTAGVGQRPRSQTSRPAAVRPAVRAATSIGPLLRESAPITIGPSAGNTWPHQ
jgi:hypothetical protein